MPPRAQGRRCAHAIGYVRVSTAEQAREGVSLDAQRGRIAAHCATQRLELAAVHADEGISGRRASNRPGLEAALKEVCASRATLVVYSLSRLARSVKDAITIAERLEKAGAQLVLLSESVDTRTASGRMFYAVLAALAAFESDLIGERTKMALHHKRTIGERFSRHAPYGSTFDTAGRLKPNESERRNVRVMQQLAGRGLSQKKIADRLPKLGIVNRSGRPFHPSQVGVFLRRERQHARVALEERFAVTD